jgi:arabinose-5-phosphate isomerase
MSTLIELARSTIGREIESLQAAMDRIDADFEKAVNMILMAPGKVVVTGLGKSGIIARKIAATFCGTGTAAIFMHPVDALHGDFGAVKQGDVVILISKSGETAEILTFLKVVRAANCQTIGIVGRRGSSLMTDCDTALDATVEHEACPLNLAPTSSAMVAMAIGDALTACLVASRGFTLDGFSKLHPSGSLGKRLSLHVKDVMHQGDAIPIIAPGSSMKQVVLQLSAKALGIVIVANREQELLGIFTDGDLRRCLEKHDNILQLTVDELMTRTPITCNENQMAIEAVELMENRPSQISVLPVLDTRRKVVGVVRIHDLVRAGIA